MSNGDTWLRGLRGDSMTPRNSKPGSRRTSEDGSAPTGDNTGDTKRSAAPLNSARGGPKGAPITPQTALKPPLPAAAKGFTPRLNRVPTLNLQSRVSADASDDDDSPRSRVNSMSENGSHYEDYVMDGDSVQVFVRVRPCNATELNEAAKNQEAPCMRTVGENTIVASIPGKTAKNYTYDKVLLETSTQHDVFESAGIPMVDNCISGYNSSIFVYGQTGAGKTFTMMGDLGTSSDKRTDDRGLAPRMIELLFEKISDAENVARLQGRETIKYCCRCSCLEIYNETITDLLNPSAANLQLREDSSKGIYVEDLSLKEVLNAEDVMALMWKGSKHRHTSETNMNAHSSRSHCVFTCIVEQNIKDTASGVTRVVCSRLNLIDLAGSERIKGGALGGSKAEGEHMKEAVHINQSLTTLGRVIMELVDAQKGGRQSHHIPYRDSRLTFLLQDSLGGNAKTMIIANVSPSPLCAAETVSTLKFVANAKCIRNKATINLGYMGSPEMMQKEIERLNRDLDSLRKGSTDPAVQEVKELRLRVEAMEKQRHETELLMQGLTTENQRFKKDAERMKARMLELDTGNTDLNKLVEQLRLQCSQAEAAGVGAQQAEEARAKLSEELATWKQQSEEAARQLHQLQASHAEQQQAMQQLHALNAEQQQAMQQMQASHAEQLQQMQTSHAQQVQQMQASNTEQQQAMQTAADKLQGKLQGLEDEMVALQNNVDEAEEAKAALATLYAEARENLETEKGQKAEALALVTKLQAEVAGLQQQCEALSGTVGKGQEALQSLQHSAAAQVAELKGKLEEAHQAAAQQAQELASVHSAGMAQAQELADVQQQLEVERKQLAAVQGQLAAEQQAHAVSKTSLTGHAAEQERKLRADLEQQGKEQQSLRLQLAERELCLAAEGEKVAGLQTALASEGEKVAGLQASLAAEGEKVAGLQALLLAERDEMAELQAALGAERSKAAELENVLAAGRQKVAGLQNALAAEKSKAAELDVTLVAERQQVVGLQTSLTEMTAALVQVRSLSEELGVKVQSLEAALQETKHRLAASEQHQQELLQQLAKQEGEYQVQRAASSSEACRLGEEQQALHALVAELRQRKEAVEATNAQQQQMLEEQRRVAEHAAMQAARQATEMQQVQGRLVQEVEVLKQENNRLAQSVSSKDATAQGLQAELQANRRALEEVQQQLAASNADAQATRSKLAAAMQQQQEDKQRDEVHMADQQDRISSLTLEVVTVQEEATARVFEMRKQEERLRAELGSVRAALVHKDQELVDLQQEVRSITDAKSELENQLKGFLIANTRQARAFQEMRRLISWATTPPSSVTSSLAQHDSTPTGLLAADDMMQSPTVSPSEQRGMDQGAKAAQRQASGADDVEQPRGPAGKQSGTYAARLSLQFDGSDDGAPEHDAGSGRVGQSPGGSVRSKQLVLGLGRQAGLQHMMEDDVNSPAAAGSAKDQVLK